MNLGDWLGIAGLAVSVVGFAVAIWQLVRTANATVATRQAVERTEKRMAINHLLILLPQFRIIEGELDRAAEEDDRQLASRALVSYAHYASEAAAILSSQSNADQTLVTDLRSSSREASLAKGILIDASRNKSTKVLTKDIRERMASLSLHVGSLSASYQMTTD
jgi:hypothetical protein